MTESTGAYHVPVMLAESIEGLQIKPNGVYVDATFGGGGHTLEILKGLDKGKLFGIDQDPDARANTPTDDRFTFVAANFRHIRRYLRAEGIRSVDGLLADLGVSSHHLDAPERGFSIRYDAELDMRMDQGKSNTAKDVVNTYSLEKLVYVLRTYGELKSPGKIAARIIDARTEAPIETTFQLIEALMPVTPRFKEFRFQAQVFQALRMEVNQEMQVLEELLEQCCQLISPGGRLVVITYHSLEDRLVKRYLRSGNAKGTQKKDFYGNLIRPFAPVQSKPQLPTEAELALNNRARSAKLRVATRLDTPYEAE